MVLVRRWNWDVGATTTLYIDFLHHSLELTTLIDLTVNLLET